MIFIKYFNKLNDIPERTFTYDGIEYDSYDEAVNAGGGAETITINEPAFKVVTIAQKKNNSEFLARVDENVSDSFSSWHNAHPDEADILTEEQLNSIWNKYIQLCAPADTPKLTSYKNTFNVGAKLKVRKNIERSISDTGDCLARLSRQLEVLTITAAEVVNVLTDEQKANLTSDVRNAMLEIKTLYDAGITTQSSIKGSFIDVSREFLETQEDIADKVGDYKDLLLD